MYGYMGMRLDQTQNSTSFTRHCPHSLSFSTAVNKKRIQGPRIESFSSKSDLRLGKCSVTLSSTFPVERPTSTLLRPR
ncbi:hypothetical protein HanXRQr2_Chr10g0439191 [Helianthus annuus]|uniref:Uncharacterized protein n=1 Tax=Helianthus annuus TaxID=4232 RepID=A0A9K3HXG1_HELAN|nr:hypothetical protein HanXRQr2_Chr10g0439191 [Helianthus annuus]